MREQTPKDYKRALEQIHEASCLFGESDTWNQGFLTALSQRGLKLVNWPDEKLSYDARYPNGYPQITFPPYSAGPIRWEERSLIVWNDLPERKQTLDKDLK